MSDPRFTRLTPRQAECLRLLARPMRPKEIARALGLSVRTVEGYIAEAVERLEAGSSLAAARMFADWEQTQGAQSPPGNLPGQESRVAEPATDTPTTPPSDAVIDTVPAATGRQVDLSSWHRNAIIFALTIGIIVSVLLLVAGGEGIARLRSGWVASHPNTHR
ncbi:MAG: helix-turn-helix transcriptional regulator [Sphingomonas bacterium]|uniref:helix-turn-helix domain-containing protein n=1 Tax=Sphingomonas bacterium TaxID=1895847 RepID=UPI0026275D00|nr:helix-turn-helix transcriptional regulator [Sphingomonas bacterium]MDB5708708.1 helix-turn-helix transcriptional regulator [Sphingomonas bacterium]